MRVKSLCAKASFRYTPADCLRYVASVRQMPEVLSFGQQIWRRTGSGPLLPERQLYLVGGRTSQRFQYSGQIDILRSGRKMNQPRSAHHIGTILMSKQLLLASSSRCHPHNYLDHCQAEMRQLFSGVSEVLFVPYARPVGQTHQQYTAIARQRFESLGFSISGIHEFPDPQAAVSWGRRRVHWRR